jgi:hypothetical protein
MKIITWVLVVWVLGSFCLWFLTRLLAPQESVLEQDEQQQQKQKQSDSSDNSQYLYFSQVIAFVGYGLIPHVIFQLVELVWRRMIAPFVLPIEDAGALPQIVSYILAAVAVIWSTYACGKLMCASMTSLQQKSKLILWPVAVLYLYFQVLIPN